MQALRKDAELDEGMWPEARAAYVLHTVATPLNDLHQLDITHRDVITDVLIASIRIVMIGRRTTRAKAALKVISKSGTWWMQGTLKRRIETTTREVSLLQKVTEENVRSVTHIFAVIETKQAVVLLMELCSGGDLMQALRKDAELDEGMWPEARAAYVPCTVATT
jgi:hypothetical protein